MWRPETNLWGHSSGGTLKNIVCLVVRVCICSCVHTHVCTHKRRSETHCRGQLSPSTAQVPGWIKLRQLGPLPPERACQPLPCLPVCFCVVLFWRQSLTETSGLPIQLGWPVSLSCPPSLPPQLWDYTCAAPGFCSRLGIEIRSSCLGTFLLSHHLSTWP